MKDVTYELRVQEYRTALVQWADLFRKLGELYLERDQHDLAEGIMLCADTLASAALWDTPDRPDRSLAIRDGAVDDYPQKFRNGPRALPLPEGTP